MWRLAGLLRSHEPGDAKHPDAPDTAEFQPHSTAAQKQTCDSTAEVNGREERWASRVLGKAGGGEGLCSPGSSGLDQRACPPLSQRGAQRGDGSIKIRAKEGRRERRGGKRRKPVKSESREAGGRQAFAEG